MFPSHLCRLTALACLAAAIIAAGPAQADDAKQASRMKQQAQACLDSREALLGGATETAKQYLTGKKYTAFCACYGVNIVKLIDKRITSENWAQDFSKEEQNEMSKRVLNACYAAVREKLGD